MRVKNEQVKKAGYYYIGHFSRGQLQIDYDSCRVVIPLNNNEYKVFDLLSNVFEIDSEDGVYFQDIEGKYCRVIFDDNYNIIALQHIIKDDYIIYLNDLGANEN